MKTKNPPRECVRDWNTANGVAVRQWSGSGSVESPTVAKRRSRPSFLA
ncbi:MAG: hypothetical protein IJ530_00010 [Treponema sp.]|nr:hypothetical protein [Treponema sp.]MBQ8678128.1 hypothetical protein [Treponema sp.]